ncbi:MAG: FecR domain-containing protein [Flavobacteriales bacterium]|nr:FecR domain-containing protein [Flavobacteriales bacterium]
MSVEKGNTDTQFDLIAKILSGNATENEVKQLDAWLALSVENTKEFERIKRIWESSSEYVEVDTNSAWNLMSNRIKADDGKVVNIQSKTKTNYWKYSVAASITLILGLLLYLLYPWAQPNFQSFNTPVLAQLQDGSKVNLNTGSALYVEDEFNKNSRKVKLKGEAFFNVEPHPEKPFLVTTDLIQVEVLGTSFNIRESEDSVVIIVKTGKVEVREFSNSDNKVQLVKGDKIVFRKNQKRFEEALEDVNEIAWNTKTLIFRRTPLVNVVHVLEKTYNQKITFSNDAIAKCELTAQFEDQSIESVLEVISVTFDLKIKNQQDLIILEGEGCD